MIEIGSVCVKIAGRDAGSKCVVVEVLDSNFVTIDGQLKRRKCNIDHIEPLQKKAKISKGASHEDVVTALKSFGIKVVAKKKVKRSPKKKKEAKKEEKKPETKTKG
jgi:large subunit ribosomal protein L14e